jgi:chemotaxis protein methyltransferase CheR
MHTAEGTRRRAASPEQADEVPPVLRTPEITPEEFNLLRALIVKETGICLADTKRTLVVSRLGKRLRALGFQTYSEYYYLLSRQDAGSVELRRLINCITTNKTSFFREPYHFEMLRDQVVPEIQQRVARAGERKIRIWSAGCSTGEEPYSIAFTLRQALGAAWPSWDVRILASDIDTDVLATAEEGLYPEESAASVPPELRQRFFMRGVGQSKGLLRIRPELRTVVTFRRINFVDSAWPIRARFDAVFCRNVIIYFDKQMQRNLIERFTAHLKPHGYLFAGHSENLSWLTDLVAPLRNTVYRLKSKERPGTRNG